MKNLLLLLFLSIAFVSFSQSKKTKANLKKMKYDVSELAFTDEKLKIYPRGFIYEVDESDSVFYFGCFSSDQKDVSNYFEGKKTSLSKFALNSQLYRGIEGYMDTMIVESLDIKLEHFKSSTGEKYSIKEDTKYLAM